MSAIYQCMEIVGDGWLDFSSGWVDISKEMYDAAVAKPHPRQSVRVVYSQSISDEARECLKSILQELWIVDNYHDIQSEISDLLR